MVKPGRKRADSQAFESRRTDVGRGRGARTPRGPYVHTQRFVQREARPSPRGERCDPSCPLFRCAKHALTLKLENGKVVAYCSWVGDSCIVASCQYASCAAKNMLLDGRCLHALKGREHRSSDSFDAEIEKELETARIKGILTRRGFGRDLENEIY